MTKDVSKSVSVQFVAMFYKDNRHMRLTTSFFDKGDLKRESLMHSRILNEITMAQSGGWSLVSLEKNEV